MTPHLEKIARAIGEADGITWTDGYIQYRAAEYGGPDETAPEKYARFARAALSAIDLTPPDFSAIGYRGLNRTRDTASSAHAAFTRGIGLIISENPNNSNTILTEGEGA